MNKHLNLLQFSKFIIVGLSNTLITLAIIFFCSAVIKLDYRISNFVGYIIGLINSFILNKSWTFKSKNRLHKEIIPFLAMFFVCYFINLSTVIFFKELLEINNLISQGSGMIIYTITNYFGNKYWAFKNINK